jgi:hypothetical protein
MELLMKWWGAVLLGIIFIGTAVFLLKTASVWARVGGALIGIVGILLLALGVWVRFFMRLGK